MRVYKTNGYGEVLEEQVVDQTKIEERDIYNHYKDEGYDSNWLNIFFNNGSSVFHSIPQRETIHIGWAD